MSRYGLFGKMTAQPGQRDALIALLLEDIAAVGEIPGCEVWIVNISGDDPDGIWIYEAWRSKDDHAASLQDERVRETIAKARPLIADFSQQVTLTPLAGKGLVE